MMTLSRERPPGENAFEGEVWDIGYLGDWTVYRVRLDDGRILRVTRANTTRFVERPIDLEERVHVGFLPDAAVITHVHFDHLDGLGNAYRLFDDLPVHAPNEVDPVTDESVADTVRRKYDYLDRITVHDETAFERWAGKPSQMTRILPLM